MEDDGIFFVLVGPSGAGKNTLMKHVKSSGVDLHQVATMTTRDPRTGEKHGKEHLFVSQERFQEAIDNDELIEWQQVHKRDQNAAYDLYGTPRNVVKSHIQSGEDLIADIEFLGAEQLYVAYPRHTVLIFVTPSDLQILAQRIMNRGDVTTEQLDIRLNRARFEMTYAPECHYLVINDIREQAERELRQIIVAVVAQNHLPNTEPENRTLPHQIDVAVTALIHRGDNLLLHQGNLPYVALDTRGAQLHQAACERLEELLDVPLQVIGPIDERFDYPAPSHVTVAGTTPRFTVNYYYRFNYPVGDYPVPDSWVWSPLADVPLPDMLRKLINS